MKTRLSALFIFAVFLALWQTASDRQWVPPIMLPSPLEIARYLESSIIDGVLPKALLITLGRLLTGYAMGLALGLLLGVMLYSSALARSTLGVLALGLQTLPSVCWAPLSILWFGQTESAMYFVVVMGSMWAIAISADNAIRNVPGIYIQAARVMGATPARMWGTVILPAALPALVGGAKLGWAFSWRSLMAAEIYVSVVGRMGMGQLLHFGRELLAMDQAIGVMAAIVAVGLLADRVVFMSAESYLRRTRGV
jgi:NitT/TauT family transport system permease protein